MAQPSKIPREGYPPKLQCRRTIELLSITSYTPLSQRLRVNHQIRAQEVRVIDENNQQVGILPLEQALKMAIERGLDLIEVSPNAQPPVCRLEDYGKYIYKQEKQDRQNKARQKKVDVKVVRLSLNIGDHDVQVRAERSRKFLQEGHKVKVELMLRGRENAHQDRAREKIQVFIAGLGEGIKIEQPVSRLGNKLITVIGM